MRFPHLKQPPHAGSVVRSLDPLVEVPALDGFRGYAAFVIVLYHCWLIAGAPALGVVAETFVSAAYLALPFFFVISGFVLFLPTCRRNGDFGSRRVYAVRRVARIVPAYYVAIVATVLCFPLVMSRYGIHARWPAYSWRLVGLIATHLTFLQREVLAVSTVAGGFPAIGFAWNGVVWSLSIEALFYVVLPLVAVRFWRRPFVLLGCAAAIELGWRFAVVHIPGFVYHAGFGILGDLTAHKLVFGFFVQFPAYVGQLALGMTAAWIYVRAHRADTGVYATVRRLAPAVQVAGGIAFLGAVYRAGHLNFGGPAARIWPVHPHDELPALAFAILILGTGLAGGRWAKPFSNPVSRWLGVVSYGTYLWHAMLAWTFFTVFHEHTTLHGVHLFLALLATVVPTAVAFGWLSYRIVELPAMRAARRFKPRKRPEEAAAVPALRNA